MQPDHVFDQQVRRLSRGREFGQGDEVHHLGEPVDQGQDGVVAPGGGKASDKVEGNIRPWSTGDGQGPEEPRWGAMGRLAAGAYVTSRDKLPGVSVQGRPPKTTPDELSRTGGPGVAG